MALLVTRIQSITTRSIDILFNSNLSTSIGIENISLTSCVQSVSNPDIISVNIDSDILKIEFSPLFDEVNYKLMFLSTDNVSFESTGGEIILEDNKKNVLFFISPGSETDPIKELITSKMVEATYDYSQSSQLIKVVNSLSSQLNKVNDSIKNVKASNYISIAVDNERVVRGDGPIDKLQNGGVYEINRVSRNPSGSKISDFFEFNSTREQLFNVRSGMYINPIIGSLTSDPISLQSTEVIGETVSDDISLSNHFVGLKIKVSKYPVIQVISVSLKRNNVFTEYDIGTYGYVLKSNRYDSNLCGINVNLEENEIELSPNSVGNGFYRPQSGDEIKISYIYKDLSKKIDMSTVSLTTLREVVREAAPPLSNRFYIKNAPIVDQSDEVYSTGGASFLASQSTDDIDAFVSDHPAFTKEISYSESGFPAAAGEYAVNYNDGEVLVYGEDYLNDGTGSFPPVITYTYRKVFLNDFDYSLDSDTNEIAINSTRNIDGIDSKISFDYESVFYDGVDYNSLAHVEVLNEYIENRLVGDYQIITNNFPISNVFRIYNETTGEIYSTSRFNDNTVTFSGRNAPKKVDIYRERVSFKKVESEDLLLKEELENSSSIRIFKCELQNDGITDSQNRFIGANFDTSVSFSKDDLFLREFFYEDRLYDDVDININKLELPGDYLIDYNNGIVYLAVSSTQDEDLGYVNYQCNSIQTKNKHILQVNNIYKSYSSTQPNISTYTVGDITDLYADVVGLEQVGQRFVNNDETRILIVGSYQSGEDGIIYTDTFASNSAVFSSDDVGRTIRLGSSLDTPVEEFEILEILNSHTVLLDGSSSDQRIGCVWNVIGYADTEKVITVDSSILSIKDIYLYSQVSSLPFSEVDGYYNSEEDSFDGNEITLSDDSLLQIGDSVIVNYNPGSLYIDYKYLYDNILISYEYGNNGLDWSISNSLYQNDEYYVSYKYGALREELLTNFGSITQIPELTNFPIDLNREVYRDIISGTIQSFVKGPTIPAIKNLVKSFTGVDPNITESAFGFWVVGDSYLYKNDIVYNDDIKLDTGKFGKGLVVDGEQYLKVPCTANIKLNEGTIETWIRPGWNGLDNDAKVTFDLLIDGYYEPQNIYIGFSGRNPEEVPFNLDITQEDIVVFGEPTNINDDFGYFVWFDLNDSSWKLYWRGHSNQNKRYSGEVSTDGQFYDSGYAISDDGYSINEASDYIRTSIDTIKFDANIDGYDFARNTGLYYLDGVKFKSGKTHYLFDMKYGDSSNTMSIFKDGCGYLNFSVFDNGKECGIDPSFYSLSTNVSDWIKDQLHHIAVSWKFNSANERDEMHLFIDGNEVPNIFKYGGSPSLIGSYDFGSVAEEIVISNSSSPIVGGFDGVSAASSNLFLSSSGDFVNDGVSIGDLFYLLDDTADGTGSPNSGASYTITAVGDTIITLDRDLTLSLSGLKYSINRYSTTVTTPVNFQDFFVVSSDADGNETELNGVDSEYPDYSIARLSDGSHALYINNGVLVGDTVKIKTLGLVFKKCVENIYVYENNGGIIKCNLPAPVSLSDVSIVPFVLKTELIHYATGYDFSIASGVIDGVLKQYLTATYTTFTQPSNQDIGRRLSIRVSGDNIDYGFSGNTITISGITGSAATTETISITDNDTYVTTQYWRFVDSIVVNIVPFNFNGAAGSFEIKEYKSITKTENSGDYAEVFDYANGKIELQIYGSGGIAFPLKEGWYTIEYPSYLKVGFDKTPDNFYIGSDSSGNNILNSTIDEFRILDYMSIDTRVGEVIDESVVDRTVTTDYVSSVKFDKDNNTLLLLQFDDSNENQADYVNRFFGGYEVASSVNTSFGNAIKCVGAQYTISNAGSVFNNDEGAIEFWVSPLKDFDGDYSSHYYLDMSSFIEEEVTSITKITVVCSQRIREIIGVRLESDVYNSEVDYFSGGRLSNVDLKTITLGIPLPSQNTRVKIIYVPLDNNGDRVSIFKDKDNFINFYVRASGVDHIITNHVDWEENTWHRIMVMWKTNSANNQDRLRLFVDGEERGTIRYGTGLLYGNGVLYGQEEVRSGTNRFLVNNIDLNDIFSKIYVGTDVFGLNSGDALIDNIRFSNRQRLQTIRVVGSVTTDTGYKQNTDYAIPVIYDSNTTGLYNFDGDENQITDFSNVINEENGVFKFNVDVIDSLDKVIGNSYLENLLVNLINRIKPAHTTPIVKFIK